MDPAKAIKILDRLAAELDIPAREPARSATNLGIEALQRLLTMRSYGIEQAIMPLPGEKK